MSTTFELCKRLYELRPGWDSESLSHWQERIGGDGEVMYDLMSDEPGICPAYTLEYLLERLPDEFERDIRSIPGGWEAGYEWDGKSYKYLARTQGTPLEAVLKLTIALIEAGLTPGEREGGHK